MEIKPQIIEKHGKKEFVVLPYEDYLKILEHTKNYLRAGDIFQANIS